MDTDDLLQKVMDYAVHHELIGKQVRLRTGSTLTLDNDKATPVLLGFWFNAHGSLLAVIRKPHEKCLVRMTHFSNIVELDPTWQSE